MKRIDMAPGEPAHPYPPFTNANSGYDEFFEPVMSESQQVDVTYAFWNSLFARPPALLRQRLIELEASKAACDDAVERAKLDAAMHAIEFVLRTTSAMPEAGATLL